MIFGFNTDIKFGEMVYHVQSEARKSEHLLQTQVFVKGRCIGKQATSYAEFLEQPDFSDDKMHEMLKVQHRRFVEAARTGRIEEEIGTAASAVATLAAAASGASATLVSNPAMETLADAPSPVPRGFIVEPAGPVIGKGIALECLPPSEAPDGSSLLLCVQVSDTAGPANGAQLTCRVASGSSPPVYLYARTASGGVADVRLALQGIDLSNTTILLQASYRGSSASRKFSLKRQ